MKKLFKIASVFLFLASFIGCKPELELEPTVKTGSIEGKVVYENENVTDYSKIQVSLISTNGLMAASYCEARGIATNARKIEDIMYTDCWGKYSFENVPEGVYTICASSDSSTKKAVLTNVVVTAGRTVTASDLGLTATGAVSGRITIDWYTEGVLGLDVFIAGTSFDGKVGIDGSFELTGIPAKYDYVLCVQKGDYVTIIDDKLAVYGNETTIVPSFNIYSENMKENQNNTTFRWRGSFDVAPYDPQLYDAYFNSMDGCSYIWNGSNWDLLARAGNDGEDGVDGNSIRWRGSYVSSEYIYDPLYLDAYYNETDGCSYIWNGSSWDLLARGGKDGDFSNPEIVYEVYYNENYISSGSYSYFLNNYVNYYGLIENSDYTINGTLINLTYSGYEKIYPSEIIYEIYYNGYVVLSGSYSYFLNNYVNYYNLIENSDYTINGTSINLTYSGYEKIYPTESDEDNTDIDNVLDLFFYYDDRAVLGCVKSKFDDICYIWGLIENLDYYWESGTESRLLLTETGYNKIVNPEGGMLALKYLDETMIEFSKAQFYRFCDVYGLIKDVDYFEESEAVVQLYRTGYEKLMSYAEEVI